MLAISMICPETCIGSSLQKLRSRSDNESKRLVDLKPHVSEEGKAAVRASCTAILHYFGFDCFPVLGTPVKIIVKMIHSTGEYTVRWVHDLESHGSTSIIC